MCGIPRGDDPTTTLSHKTQWRPGGASHRHPHPHDLIIASMALKYVLYFILMHAHVRSVPIDLFCVHAFFLEVLFSLSLKSAFGSPPSHLHSASCKQFNPNHRHLLSQFAHYNDSIMIKVSSLLCPGPPTDENEGGGPSQGACLK